jgi:hypothetical protein
MTPDWLACPRCHSIQRKEHSRWCCGCGQHIAGEPVSAEEARAVLTGAARIIEAAHQEDAPEVAPA